MNPFSLNSPKTLEIFPQIFHVRQNLIIVILECMHSSFCCLTSPLSSLRTQASFSYSLPYRAYITFDLLLRVHMCYTSTHTHTYTFTHTCAYTRASPTSIPRGILGYEYVRQDIEETRVRFQYCANFSICRYDCVDSSGPACRYLAEVSNHHIPVYRTRVLPQRSNAY